MLPTITVIAGTILVRANPLLQIRCAMKRLLESVRREVSYDSSTRRIRFAYQPHFIYTQQLATAAEEPKQDALTTLKIKTNHANLVPQLVWVRSLSLYQDHHQLSLTLPLSLHVLTTSIQKGPDQRVSWRVKPGQHCR